MTFQGLCLPFRPRFVLFFVGIAFWGAVSGPLLAADNPAPSTWDKVFGSTPKASESQPNEQKANKAKSSKEAPKKTKSSPPKKTGKAAKTETTAAPGAGQASLGSAPPLSEKTEVSSPKAEATPNQVTGAGEADAASSAPFWQGLFSRASSTSPFLEEGTQSNTPLPSPVPASPPSVDASKTVAPTPPVNEPSNTEPFWKRIFGQASSKQPDFIVEQSSAPEPLKETIQTPVSASSKSSGDEEPSFWQKIFGSKSADKKVEPSKTSATAAPVEQNRVAPIVSPAPAAISPPIAAAQSQSTTDTKANFSLASVCEREKCELMVLFDAPINKANVDKFIQSTASIPAGTAVLLNSTDGDLNSGIRLGQVLRQKSFNTRVGRTQLNKKILNEIDGQCYSACILAFAGGVNRRIDPNDKIGIYALRSNTKTVNENEMKTAVNSLGSYFDQMGVDRRFVDQMLQAKGTSVSLISLSSAKLLNLDNGTRIVTYPWRMQALDDGLLIILVTEKQATNNFSITLGLTKQNKDKDFRLTIYAKPLSGNLNLNQLADHLNRDTRLQLAFNNQAVAPSLIKPGEATSNGVQTAISLSDKDLMGISSALEFELNLLHSGNNPYKLDGVTIFGTSGLKGALAAIKK
jgi:hypothetical protein